MCIISVSIDISGSTEAKAKLRSHSAGIQQDPVELYKSFQRQILRVESTFWTMLRSSHLDIERLFLIKSIGDELWYAYDLAGLEEHERRAAVAKMIKALVSLQSKDFEIVAGPPEDPFTDDWKNVASDKILRIDLPLKIAIDVIAEALEAGDVREKHLASEVVSLLFSLGKPGACVEAGNDTYIDLCNRLGIANRVKTEKKVHSSVRSDYIGWEVDRFFRLTKQSRKNGVLIGPEILSDFESNNLIEYLKEDSHPAGWSVSSIRIKLASPGSVRYIGDNYKMAKMSLPSENLKGVGVGCDLGIIYSQYGKSVDFGEEDS